MIKIEYKSNENAVLLWQNALKKAVETNDKEIYFPHGKYHFYTDGTTLKHCFISNNDASVKNIAIYLNNINDLTITGDDAEFIFHGRISPFVLENCRNIKISGISVDFSKRFSFEAKVIDSDNHSTVFDVDGDWQIDNGSLRVFNDGLDNMTGKLACTAFNIATGEICRDSNYYIVNQNIKAEKNHLRLPFALKHNESDFFIRHQARHTPAFVIDRSTDIELENINIYHAEGMGVVGQNSKNILLDNVNTVPAANKNLSVTDDAVHFSECYGSIIIKNCTFRQTLDDAINIHGMYRRLRKIGDAILLEACHFQQFGLWDGQDGDTIEVLKKETMQPYAELQVKNFLPGTRQFYCLELEDTLPEEFTDGDMARIMRTANSEVIIENCNISNNMSRGILLSGCKKGIIRNNKLHSPGHGIYLAGDANYWYESGPNENIEICGNIFDKCCYTQFESNPVTVDPVIPQKIADFKYHNKVSIHDNIFDLNNSKFAVQAHSLKELIFENNQIISDKSNRNQADFIDWQ